MAAQAPSAVERAAIRTIAVRLVPFVAPMFFVNYLDRTAISFAGPNGMNDDLGLTAAQFGLASGIFFIGYIVLEIPSNIALHKFGPRKWLARIIQIFSVARAVSAGAGILLTYGNYAGDVLHCAEAAAMLNERGIPTKTLAFSGCTLPGAPEPLFTVAAGRMAVGLGIHGEPGTGEIATPSADALAELLVSRLLEDLPADLESARGARAGLILNGLGTVKHEELFVVYRKVAQLLKSEGVEVVHPEVGEFVTSYDLAGLSLTLFWLDDELEHFWTLPVHRGVPQGQPRGGHRGRRAGERGRLQRRRADRARQCRVPRGRPHVVRRAGGDPRDHRRARRAPR